MADFHVVAGSDGTLIHPTVRQIGPHDLKEALRKAGIPCAASIGSGDRAEIIDFAKRVGFPLIVKPRDAAGASGTYRVD